MNVKTKDRFSPAATTRKLLPDKHLAPSTKRVSLIELRTDLRVLLFEMEHNKNLGAPLWQITSIRKSLDIIKRTLNGGAGHD